MVEVLRPSAAALDGRAGVSAEWPRVSVPRALPTLPLDWQQDLQKTPLDLRQIAAAQGCLLESAALNQKRDSGVNDFVHAA